MNGKEYFGNTPLHFAAYNGHTAIVEALITAGAVVNQANDYIETPLHLADQKGHTEIVEILRAETSYFPACTIM